MSGLADGEILSRVLEALNKLGHGYAWPGNVRELEQSVRCILLTGSYRGDTCAVVDDDSWRMAFERGDLTVKEVTAGYCQRLFKRYGRFEEVARRTGLDWRTVKKYVETR
jgi:transcriptional regulator with GAF, ATPase, and Fis domain